MIKKWLFIGIGMSLIIFTFTVTNAFSNPDKMTCKKKCQYSQTGCDASCLKGLDDAQKEKVTQLRQKYFENVKTIETSLQDSKSALREELVKAAPDGKKARKIQKKISELEAKLEMSKVNFILKVKEINPDFHCPKTGVACCMTNPHKMAPACPRASAGKASLGECPHSKKVY